MAPYLYPEPGEGPATIESDLREACLAAAVWFAGDAGESTVEERHGEEAADAYCALVRVIARIGDYDELSRRLAEADAAASREKAEEYGEAVREQRRGAGGV